MDTFSNVQRFASLDDISVRSKSNYDFFIELILAAMFSVAVVSWTQVLVEAGGLICVPSYGNTSSYGIPSARYVGSRCQLELSPRVLLFFPYFSLFSFAVLFVCHISWIKMPYIVRKLKNYYDLFQQMEKLEPRFDSASVNLLPTFEHNGHDQKFVKRILDRLMIMLIEKSYLRKSYIRKNQITAFISLCLSFVTIIWLWFSSFGVTYFACDINIESSTKITLPHTCDVSNAVFIYGQMVFHFIAVLFIFLLSTTNASRHLFRIKLNDVFPGDEIFDNFKGLPGTTDFLFCVYIFTKSAPTSSYLFNAVKYILKQAGDLGSGLHNDCYIDFKANETDPDIQKKKMLFLDKQHKFGEGALLVHYITYQLGLVEIPNDQGCGHLYDCLEYIAKQVVPHDFPFVEATFNERIAEEILQNRDYYKFYIDMAQFYQSNYKYDVPTKNPYEHLLTSIKNIRDCYCWGDYLSIAAAANLFGVKIYLIDEGRSHGKQSKHKITEFEPFMAKETKCSFIMTFIEPCYYHNTKNRENLTEENLSMRKDFETSSHRRSLIRQQALRLIYHNATETYPGIPNYGNLTHVTNNITITKNSNQMEFIPHYGITHNANARQRCDVNTGGEGVRNMNTIFKLKTAMKNAAIDAFRFKHLESSTTDIELEEREKSCQE